MANCQVANKIIQIKNRQKMKKKNFFVDLHVRTVQQGMCES